MDKQTGKKADNYTSLLTDLDLFLFNEGSHSRIYDKMGAHPMTVNGIRGTFFAVWAPNASQVSVIGDFNGWNKAANWLSSRGKSGIWEGFIPGIGQGCIYKYHIISRNKAYEVDKADPYAFYYEIPPAKASIVWDIRYEWADREWMETREENSFNEKPVAIYEIHLGSWRRKSEEDDRPLTYREITPLLVEYIKQMGFTHVEFLPVMEHPFYGSWGYQTTGYFAPTSRFGTPQDFMSLVDELHQNGIGVILDWVPSHFPRDEHGPGYFDGTHLYEHEDPRNGVHPDWHSFIFNYGRNEVRSFLLSSAQCWLDKYHIDGIRVDGVASMLYLDYSRKKGEWIPNKFGGRENLDAVLLLRKFNEMVYKEQPGIFTIAEESTAWPGVSRPIYNGGLGFGFKWDMGWMHDILDYMKLDPIYRKYHHKNLTFRSMYAYTENFILPLSHDEVVHGKGSLMGRMPGDEWQKCAGLRLLSGYMYTQPGKKLLFMGGEFGQIREWAHDQSLDWRLLDNPSHAGIKKWVEDLNRLYRNCPALYSLDCEPGGFEWIDCNDVDHSIISFMRRGRDEDDILLVICNFTPVTHFGYRIGAPRQGFWQEILNSDAKDYGGSGQGNLGGVEASPFSLHGQPYSLTLTIPPLSMEVFKPVRGIGVTPEIPVIEL
jgi:1,4-alpha-glucan branching enzyme